MDKQFLKRLVYLQYQIEVAKGNKPTLKECLKIVLTELRDFQKGVTSDKLSI